MALNSNLFLLYYLTYIAFTFWNEVFENADICCLTGQGQERDGEQQFCVDYELSSTFDDQNLILFYYLYFLIALFILLHPIGATIIEYWH